MEIVTDIATISFKEFKIVADTRKNIATKLAALQASQTATAKLVGVVKSTIHEDLYPSVRNQTKTKNNYIDNQDINLVEVRNQTDDEIEPFKGSITLTDPPHLQKSRFDTDVKKIVDQAQKEVSKRQSLTTYTNCHY